MFSKRFRFLPSHSTCCTWIIAVFLFYPRNGFVQGGMENENQLKKYLYTAEFDPTVRPVKNSSDNVTVTVDISFSRMVDLNEKLQVLQSEIWVRLLWKDRHFVWAPSEFGNITVFLVPSSNIWTPDIVIYNEVGMESGQDPSAFPLKVQHDGTVKWLFKRNVETFCKIDAHNFPFDKQECPYRFGSWAHSGDLIDVVRKSEQGDSTFYNDNGEWNLLNIRTKRHMLYYQCCEQPFPDVTFTIELKRRSLYYVYNLILPCIFITILHLAAFLLPVDSGEKISMNVTILLGLTVFLLLVADITPPQSEVIPVIGQFFGACIFLVSLSTVANVLVVDLYFRGNRGLPVPTSFRRCVFSKLGRILCYGNLLDENPNEKRKETAQRKITKSGETVLLSVRAIAQRKNSNGDEKDLSGSTDAADLGCYDNQALSVETSQPTGDLGVLHNHIEDKAESEQKIMRDWILVSIVADRLFFLLFFLGDLAAVTYILYNICGSYNET